MLQETHADDPRIDMEVYERNGRSIRFHEKLGFVVDTSIEPRDGEVYEGKWITMATTGQVFSARLADLLTP
jgi:RimJ/RimL family protein N-acetyltransferase